MSTIKARYAGRCATTNRAYPVGAALRQAPTGGWEIADAVTDEITATATIRLDGGSGYGCEGWTPGRAYRAGQWAHGTVSAETAVYVLAAHSTYMGENDGSGRVGEDNGYLHTGLARLATPAEEAVLVAEETYAAGVRAKHDADVAAAAARNLWN